MTRPRDVGRVVTDLLGALHGARETFSEVSPYPHRTGDTLFGHAFAAEAALTVDALPWRRVEAPFYSQDESRLDLLADQLPPAFRSLLAAASDELVLAEVKQLLGSEEVRLASLVAHRLHPGDEMDVHTDENPYGERLCFCWMFGAPPRGGAFRVHDSPTGATRVAELVHRPDRWVLFQIGARSFHSVSTIEAGSVPRLSVVFTWSVRTIGDST